MFIKKPMLLIFLILLSLSIILIEQYYNNTKIILIKPVSSLMEIVSNNDVIKTKLYHQENIDYVCEITKEEVNSYCNIKFFLSPNIKSGLNLSDFKSINFNIENINDYAEDNISIYLNNYNYSYSNKNNIRSLKPHSIFINHINRVKNKNIDLKNFNIDKEWVEDFNIDYNNINQDLSNISVIQFQTSKKLKKGIYKIRIKEIAFNGFFIEPIRVAELLLIKWLIILILYTMVFLKREYTRANANEIKNNNLKNSTELIIEEYKKDSLTGIYNRHAFRQWLDKNKESMYLSAIYMDLDHFKNINDIYGHKKGDEILCQFTDLVNKHVNKGDIFCRWGGEEFLLFCKNVDIEDAIQIMKKIQIDMAEKNWNIDGKVTLSAGIAYGHINEISKIIEIADKSLYIAKNSGRDQFYVS